MNIKCDYHIDMNMGVCPQCGQSRFHPFIYNETNKRIGERVGYCEGCGYCLLPEEFFSFRHQLIYQYGNQKMIKLGRRIAERSNADFFISSFWAFGQTRNNNLFRYLQSFFEEKEIESAFNRYAVGTSLFNKWENACIFWKISREGKYLAYKLIQYLPEGERAGHRDPKISILQHSLVDSESGEQRYCLFGLHLLNNPANQKKIICIVESEKTAIIASMAYPEGLWLATGSSRYLNKMNVDDIPETMRDTIILFPDPDLEGDTDKETGISDDWNVRKQWFKSLKGAKISGFMKQYVKTNRNELSKELGDKYKEFDIADYILRTKSEGGILADFYDIIQSLDELQ